MDSIYIRTSVTIDEAVAMLLGLADGPIEYRLQNDNASEEEREQLDSVSFSLQEYLDGDKEQLESDLAEAKVDQLPITDIEAKREALQQHVAVIALAKTYLCAINDELNRGAMSALRVDVKLTNNSFHTYITLTSLDAWAASKGYLEGILAPVITGAALGFVETAENKKVPKKVFRQLEQEEAIVAEIKRLGHNPLELPINEPGKEGVKAEVRNTLQGSDFFGNVQIFNKAWDRLRQDKKIVDKK